MDTGRRAAGRLLHLALLCLGLGAAAPGAQEHPRLDFLDERLPIPESSRYSEADYIESGVGLSFGVDKRLSYFSGNYVEATQRFEEAVSKFRYKSEIWVYLARAYFYLKEPEKAFKTLDRALALMPDLKTRFWEPLQEGLLWEIRRRMANLQARVDFYSAGRAEVLSLFRLYRTVKDYESARQVILASEAKARKMAALLTMASGESQKIYRAQFASWRELSAQLRSELKAVGVEVPPAAPDSAYPEVAAAAADKAALVETTRILRLRVEFYEATQKEYRQLFANYLLLGRGKQAAQVLEALEREVGRIKLQASMAGDVPTQLELRDEVSAWEALRSELKQQLPGAVDAAE